MTAITEQLRQAAKCAPMWKIIFEAATDEVDRLRSELDMAQAANQAMSEIVGLNEIRAEAVREAEKACAYEDIGGDCFDGEIKVCLSGDLEDYANKLERGEL